MLDTVVQLNDERKVRIELTFDDGNVSDRDHALEALSRRGLTASFFVCAGRVGKAHYLDRAALLELLAAGMSIGSHGWGHVDWRRVKDGDLAQEISVAKQAIEDIVERPVAAAAIPFGSYDRRVLKSLRDFARIYTSDGGFARSGARITPRNSYSKDWSAGTLAARATRPDSVASKIRHSAAAFIKRNR
jgi:peptidoglycan/xylan/chitin deacetylase (PgdA/CDA1 family)